MSSNGRRREPLGTILAGQPLSAQVPGARGTVYGSAGWVAEFKPGDGKARTGNGSTFDRPQVVVVVGGTSWPEAQLGVEGEGFAEFIDARERALQRTAWWLTGDWALAEDLVQAALVRLWPKWVRIRRLDDPELYVRRVMVNLWASWSRRRWRKEQITASVPDSHAPGDMAAEVAARLAVRSALGSLTARQRAVLVLRVFDDLPEALVAQLLGCSVRTVKSTLSRALARLREEPLLAEFLEREAR